MVQRELCSQGGVTHGVVEVGVAKGRPAALHDGGVEGQAETAPEAGLDLSALELARAGEWPTMTKPDGSRSQKGARERASTRPSRGCRSP
jgi:hypothetical protein